MKTGALKWSSSLGSAAGRSGALSEERGELYVADEGGELHALSTKDGSKLWRYDGGAAMKSAVAITGTGDLVGAAGVTLFKLNATGAPQWTHALGAHTQNDPTLPGGGADGVVLIGDESATFYAIHLQARALSLALAPFPPVSVSFLLPRHRPSGRQRICGATPVRRTRDASVMPAGMTMVCPRARRSLPARRTARGYGRSRPSRPSRHPRRRSARTGARRTSATRAAASTRSPSPRARRSGSTRRVLFFVSLHRMPAPASGAAFHTAGAAVV